MISLGLRAKEEGVKSLSLRELVGEILVIKELPRCSIVAAVELPGFRITSIVIIAGTELVGIEPGLATNRHRSQGHTRCWEECK